MSWITLIWSSIAGICIAVAALHLLVWLKSRDSWPYLLFSIASLGGACLALLELALMQAQSPAQFGELWHWYHVGIFTLVVALVWFVKLYLQAGRLWLAWLITGLRGMTLVLTFSLEPNLNFLEITGLRTIHVLGETVVMPIGEKNPWTNITNASGLLFLIFVLDAAFSAWRSGKRRRASVIGITFGTAIVVGVVLSEMLNRGILPIPFTLSFPFLIVLIGVSFELSVELVRVNHLARELLRSQKRLGLATSAANVGIWDWDIERDEVWVTDNIRQRLGLQENEKLSFKTYLEKVDPDDQDAIQQLVHEAWNAPDEFELEYRILAENNEKRWIRIRGSMEFGPAGKPKHMRGISLDITEQKRIEEELEERRHELAHASRVSSLGQLSMALAHEINQPLGAILRNAEAAELFLGHTPPDIEEVRAILADIRNDDQRAATVIDRMRMLFRRGELKFESLELHKLVEDVSQLLHSEFQTCSATILIDIPRTLPKVYGDRIHLQQVIMNLLLNSLDALKGPMGQNRQIIVRGSQANEDMVDLAVIDHGVGIEPEQLPSLFEPFFSTKTKGTGIGLAITRTIVEAHGGMIMAENNPSGGATVRFTLKAAQEEVKE